VVRMHVSRVVVLLVKNKIIIPLLWVKLST
jgi:hypothetical protein